MAIPMKGICARKKCGHHESAHAAGGCEHCKCLVYCDWFEPESMAFEAPSTKEGDGR